MLRRKKKCSIALIAGITAVVVGAYLLHKKIMQRRLRKLSQKQAMNLAMFDFDDDDRLYDYYDDEARFELLDIDY
jgi:hypothetical protein